MGGYLGNDIDDIDDNVATLYEGASDQWYVVWWRWSKKWWFSKMQPFGIKEVFFK